MTLLETILLIDLLEGNNRGGTESYGRYELSSYEKKKKYKRFIAVSVIFFLVGSIAYTWATLINSPQIGTERIMELISNFLTGGIGAMMLYSGFQLFFSWVRKIFTSGLLGGAFILFGGWIVIYLAGTMIGFLITIPRLIYCAYNLKANQ